MDLMDYSPIIARFWRPNMSHAWPDVDIAETEREYVFSIEIPGAVKDDVKIWIENDILTVSGVKKNSMDDSANAIISERAYGKFERSFRLPENVDRNKVSADFVDGILVVVVPKAVEAMKKEIKIG